MMSQEYKRTVADPCVYVRRFPYGKFIVVLLYVDDMLIVGQNADIIRKLKRELSKTFDMKDLGIAKHILEMEISSSTIVSFTWLNSSSMKFYFLF